MSFHVAHGYVAICFCIVHPVDELESCTYCQRGSLFFTCLFVSHSHQKLLCSLLLSLFTFFLFIDLQSQGVQVPLSYIKDNANS